MAKNAMLFVEGRLSFPAIFQPEAFNEGEPRFSATLLVPKGGADDQRLHASVQALMTAAGFKKLPADKIAVKDGDEFEYDSHQGMTVLRASNPTRPVVIDRNKAPLVEADGRPYSGCYVKLKVELWVQDNSFGKRINAKLHGVQFVSDGDPFGAGGSPSDDGFEDLDGDAPF